jgi:hypothetical protein
VDGLAAPEEGPRFIDASAGALLPFSGFSVVVFTGVLDGGWRSEDKDPQSECSAVW